MTDQEKQMHSEFQDLLGKVAQTLGKYSGEDPIFRTGSLSFVMSLKKVSEKFVPREVMQAAQIEIDNHFKKMPVPENETVN